MKLKWVSAVFVVEFLVSIYFLYLFDLLDLKIVVSVGLVEMGAAIFIDFLNGRNEKRRIEREQEAKKREKLEQEETNKRQKLEQAEYEHSKKLIEILEKWLDYLSKRNKEKEYEYHMSLGSAYYKPRFKSVMDEPKDPDIKNFDNLKNHFTDKSYGLVSNLWSECKSDAKNILEMTVAIWNQLEKVCVEKNISPHMIENYGIVWEIYKESENFVEAGTISRRFRIIPEESCYRVGQTQFKMDTSEEKAHADKFIKIVYSIVENKDILEQIKLRNEMREKLDEKINGFKQELEKIRDNVMLYHNNLKGVCDDCP